MNRQLPEEARDERRAAPSRPAIPAGAEPGHGQSSALVVPGEGPGQVAQRGLQGRPVDSPGEGLNERPEGFQRVTRVLAERGHHDAPRWLAVSARTCAEAADALGVQVGQIAKSVVFRRRADGAAVLVVAAGDKRVDEHKVAAQVGPIGRADAAFVKAQTGFSIGGVSPVAHLQQPVLLIDRELFRFGEVWAAAGHPNGVFRASPDQLVALTGAPVVDVAAEPADR
jgi:prolyl-tRNA editing enzyme YbaK/EbsC (Cys-tRNA(Pro) deacylase)